MSFDINPLGATMHLRELDRQASGNSRLPSGLRAELANVRSPASHAAQGAAGWSLAGAGRALGDFLSASTTALKRLAVLRAS